jgi:hypothetical protein
MAIIVDYFTLNIFNFSKDIVKYIVLALLAFLVIVTPIYHPWDKNKIAFLSNVSTFGLTLLLYTILN